MNNEIILRNVYGKVSQTYFIQPCPNPRTGRLPECVKPVDSNGDMILSEKDKDALSDGTVHFVPANFVFEITDGTRFDLDEIVDAANWAAIEHCNWIAKDRFQRDTEGNLIIDGNAKRYGIADLYVERPGEITTAKISKKQLVHQACDYIYKDSEKERIKKCKVLGRNLQNAIPADILDFLISKAEKEPKKIIEMYEGEEWKTHLFVLDAVDQGVIRKSDNIFTYDGKTLGASMDATILFLRNPLYKKITDSIKLETYPHLRPKQELREIQQEIDDTLLEGDKNFVEPEPTSKPKNTKSK